MPAERDPQDRAPEQLTGEDLDAGLAAAFAPADTADALAEGPGTLIGPYKLLQKIGEGGFGVVYMAEQQQPIHRRVALKVIKLGMDTAAVAARFEAERQALALMDHPSIARVFDAGATETGRPFFVMELVKGVPITEYCDRSRLDVRQRLELFAAVCQAVQHAHQKGIIHRDIKPTNVMVTLHDGVPVPKVIDFGVAKATQARLTERTLFTQYGQFVGTPAYMSPEQAEMSGLDVDTRSDIYSLGVLLYELLTGSTPLDQTRLRSIGYAEMQRIIREEEPPKPSTRLSQSGDALASICAGRRTEPRKLGGLLRGDLDWIVMKALEKDRTRRYETANGFGMDVLRYLNDEPVVATPPSAGYKLRKLARKHKKLLVTATALATLLVLATLVSSWQTIRALRAEAQATAERNRAVFRFIDLASGAASEHTKYFQDFATLTFMDASSTGDWQRAEDDLARAEQLLGDRQPRWWQTNWWIVGPFAGHLDESHAPDHFLDPFQPLPAMSGTSARRWSPCVAHPSGLLDIDRVLEESGLLHAQREHISTYAQMRIYSAEERDVAIDCTADDRLRLWLNGQSLSDEPRQRMLVPARLKAGWNTVLARIDNDKAIYFLQFTIRGEMGDLPTELREATIAEHEAIARDCALRGDWPAAAKAFAQACEVLDEEHHWTAYQYGFVLLHLGEQEQYRQHCARMLESWAGTTDPMIAERTAKLCLLAPTDTVDLDGSARLAEFAVTAGRDHPLFNWFLLTHGIAQYRLGHFEDALRTFSACLQDVDPQRDPHVLFFRAMALHQLQREGAREVFAQARQLMEDKFRRLQQREPLSDWHDVIGCRITHDEAQALLAQPGS